MIEVFSTFYRLINHHRQVNKGDGIEQNNQPIGADCRMNGKEKQKSNDTSGYPLRSEREQIPSPNHLLPFQLKPYNNASHNQQYAYTRQRRQWKPGSASSGSTSTTFDSLSHQRTNTDPPCIMTAPLAASNILKGANICFRPSMGTSASLPRQRSIPNSSHSFPFVHR